MTIVKNFWQGLIDIPDTLKMAMLGLLVTSITGVLIHSPDAIHGINHDYHAVWQQRVTKQKSISVHTAPVCFTGTQLYISFVGCLIEKSSGVSGADIRFPVLAIIQTWRLLL